MKRLIPALLSALAFPAAADEVVLRNGARIEGRVLEMKDEIVVHMDSGALTLRRRDVVRIIPGASALQEFEAAVRALKPDDVEGRYALALWARRRELDTSARRLLYETLALSPNHEGARAELGYIRHEGRWMTEDDRRAALGLVRFRGAWIPQAEAHAIQRKEAEQETATAVELEMTRARRILLEAEAEYVRARAEAERARAEIEREQRQFQSRQAALIVTHVHGIGGTKFPCCCPKK